MLIKKTLKSLGLDEKETKVYLSTLELGKASVLQIAKKADLKRPTVYLYLDSLIKKNFANTVSEGGKTYYVAEKPTKLLAFLKDKERALRLILPQLEAKYNLDKNKPQIRFYENKESIKRVYEEVYNSPEIIFYGTSIKYFQKKFKNSFEKGIKTFHKNQTKVKELVSSKPFEREYAKKYQTKNHKIKIIPQGFEFFSDNAIFGDKVAIFSIQKDFFAVVIENKKIAKTYKSLFNMAWKCGEKI